MKHFHNLRVRFADYELDQKDVAELAGMKAPTLSKRMNGKKPFRLNEIQAIAKVLEIPPEEYHRYFFEEPGPGGARGCGT